MQQWSPILCGEPVNVEKVIVNGTIIYANGELSTLDIEQVRIQAKQCVKTLMSKLS